MDLHSIHIYIYLHMYISGIYIHVYIYIIYIYIYVTSYIYIYIYVYSIYIYVNRHMYIKLPIFEITMLNVTVINEKPTGHIVRCFQEACDRRGVEPPPIVSTGYTHLGYFSVGRIFFLQKRAMAF